MKKTLSTLLALCACATAFAAEEEVKVYTLSPDYTPVAADTANLHGWSQSLESADLKDGVTTIDTTTNSTFYLQSVGIMSGNHTSTTTTDYTTVKLAVYSSTGTFLAISSNQVSYGTELTSYTFNFSNVELNYKSEYTFKFVAATSDKNSQEVSQFRTAMYKTAPGDDDFLIVSGGSPSWTANYSPYAVYTVTNQRIPEPATATLSLLALAGLAARRRRK